MPCALCSKVTEEPYGLVVARPAARAIQTGLPESVAAAVVEFISGPLIENPQRVGKALRNELEGLHSARRGTFRVVYRIDEDDRSGVITRTCGWRF